MKQALRRRRNSCVYTEGELNKLIDSLIHPLAKENPYIMILDGVLHGIIEQNPSASTIKFIRYNLPKVLKELAHAR